MVSKTLSDIWHIWGFVSAVFLALVLLFPDQIRDLITSVFGVSSEVFVFYAIIALLVFGVVSSIVIIIINMRHRPSLPQKGIATIPIPSQKKTSWLSKLKRPPTPKENRLGYWIVMISMMILGIALLTFQAGLSSELLQKGGFFDLLVGIGIGIVMIVLSAWLLINELYNMWDSRKQYATQRKTAYINTITAYNDALASLKKASQPQTLEIRLDEFENRLRALCSLNWDENVSSGIEALFKYIPDKMSDDSHVDRYVFWLKMIISSHSKETIPLIKERFMPELEKMYENPKLMKTDCDVLYILMEIHGYDGDYLLEVADDAAYQWSLVRFNELADYFKTRFAELKKRSPEDYRKFCDKLDEKMQKAEGRDTQAFDRLKGLCKFARSMLGT
jgi:hypothetical protein